MYSPQESYFLLWSVYPYSQYIEQQKARIRIAYKFNLAPITNMTHNINLPAQCILLWRIRLPIRHERNVQLVKVDSQRLRFIVIVHCKLGNNVVAA